MLIGIILGISIAVILASLVILILGYSGGLVKLSLTGSVISDGVLETVSPFLFILIAVSSLLVFLIVSKLKRKFR